MRDLPKFEEKSEKLKRELTSAKQMNVVYLCFHSPTRRTKRALYVNGGGGERQGEPLPLRLPTAGQAEQQGSRWRADIAMVRRISRRPEKLLGKQESGVEKGVYKIFTSSMNFSPVPGWGE